ncbi:MAG: hypothetical protein IT303_13745 [Dehalococcoidia bacterium]|nr:hypothetical protein [Dehalococcoidia bacterium]
MTEPADEQTPPPATGAEGGGVRRKRILTEKEVHLQDPQRQGCLRWGAILGIVVGVLVAFLVVPPCMRWAFQPERVGPGETFDHEGLRAVVTSVVREGDDWVVSLDVTVTKTWHAGLEDVHLELDDGSTVEPVPGQAAPPRQVPFGEPGTVALRFPAGSGAEPVELVIDDPQIEFELPAPS